MFERYTEQARRTIFFARYEASQFGVTQIGVEHLLLGILREDKQLAVRVLGGGSQIEAIRKKIEASKQPNAHVVSTSVDLPLSLECKRALAYGAEESQRLAHGHIGTDHLLAGMIRDENSLASKILRECGVTIETVREGIAPVADVPPSGMVVGMGGIGPFTKARRPFFPLPQPFGHSHDWFTLFHRATDDTRIALVAARQEASERHCGSIETVHLLLALLRIKDVTERHFPGGSPAEQVSRGVKPLEKPRETVPLMSLPYTEESMRAIRFAVEDADRSHYDQILPDHLLLGLLKDKYCQAAEILNKLGVTAETIHKTIAPPKVQARPDQADSQEGGTHV